MINFIKEFFIFLKYKKKLLLLPIFIVIFLMGTLFVLTEGTVLAPLIYVLF